MSTVNLLPEDYLERRAQQRANVLCLVLFSIVMAGVVGAALVSEEKARQVRQIREQVSREYQQAGEKIAQLQELEASKKKVLAKAEMAAALLERVPRSYLLACLTNALPPQASLTRVDLKTAKPKIVIQSATKGRSKFAARAAKREAESKAEQVQAQATRQPLDVILTVTGLADNDVHVAQFISAMKANPLTKNVELVYSEEQMVEKTPLREFQVTMELNPHAEVETLEGGEVEALAANEDAALSAAND